VSTRQARGMNSVEQKTEQSIAFDHCCNGNNPKN
jgi:hypothetical protein